MKRAITIASIALLAAGLVFIALMLPPMGEADSPTATNVIPRYLERGVEEAGADNIITGIILNYRGYDTMGEVTVIFSALAAVLAIVSRERLGNARGKDDEKTPPSPAIQATVRVLVPFILLFSVYTILHGDISPGGGFQGGAVIGASFIIFTTVFGLAESLRRIPAKLRVPLEGAAPITFFVIGLAGILVGASFLTYVLPGVSPATQPVIRTIMLLIIETGIGTGGAIIFTSILFALLKE